MLDFVIKMREVSYSEFRDYVVNEDSNKRIYAKQTFSKRIRSFAKTGLLKKKLDEETGRPRYYVPDEVEEELADLKNKQEAFAVFDEYWDSLPSEEKREKIKEYRAFTELNTSYNAAKKKINELASQGTQRAFDEADIIAKLYETMKSIIKKHALNPKNIPLVQKVEEWKEECSYFAHLSASDEIADSFI